MLTQQGISELNATSSTKEDNTSWLSQQKDHKIFGLNFGPYIGGQYPSSPGYNVTETQLRTLISIVAPYTLWIRTYSCTNGLEEVGPIAHEAGLKSAIQAWLGKDMEANDEEIYNLIQLANAGHVDMAVVGSEVIQRGDLSDDQLISYIYRVKRSIPSGIPVTYGFAYSELNNSKIVSAIDVVGVDIYPFYAGPYGINISKAVINMDSQYKNYVLPNAKGKKVIILETGWPSCGGPNGAAVPSLHNATRYFNDFVNWAENNNVPYFYFEAFDEGWKVKDEGTWGSCWGVWRSCTYLTEKLKYNYTNINPTPFD